MSVAIRNGLIMWMLPSLQTHIQKQNESGMFSNIQWQQLPCPSHIYRTKMFTSNYNFTSAIGPASSMHGCVKKSCVG